MCNEAIRYYHAYIEIYSIVQGVSIDVLNKGLILRMNTHEMNRYLIVCNEAIRHYHAYIEIYSIVQGVSTDVLNKGRL